MTRRTWLQWLGAVIVAPLISKAPEAFPWVEYGLGFTVTEAAITDADLARLRAALHRDLSGGLA